MEVASGVLGLTFQLMTLKLLAADNSAAGRVAKQAQTLSETLNLGRVQRLNPTLPSRQSPQIRTVLPNVPLLSIKTVERYHKWNVG